MRIGIDCRTILDPQKKGAGVEHYNYFLVKNLLAIDQKNEYILFFDSAFKETKEFERKNVKIKYFPFSQYKNFLPFAYSHLLLSAFLNREKLDLFHSPTATAPLAYSGNIVVTVHDLAIYHNKDWFPGNQAFSVKIAVPQTLKKAKKIIAVSESTKWDIINIFKISPEKIKVVYEGVEKVAINDDETRKIKEKFNLEKDFIFFVGTFEPRKNIINLIKAFLRLTQNKELKGKINLVLAGKKGWKYKEIFEILKAKEAKENIKYLDYIDVKEKFILLKEAKVFVFPSFYEGFGVPVLEAMSLGTPVITSKNSSLTEVGGKAVIYIDPHNIEEIAESINKVLQDEELRQKMKEEGLIQIKKFSWEKCARETLEIYKSVISNK